MKRLLLFGAGLLVVGLIHAAPPEVVGRVGTPFTITLSSSAWTAVTTTTINTSFLGLPNKTAKWFVKINNASAVNSNAFNCTVSTGSTPSLTVGTGDIEINIGGNPKYEMDSSFTLYCISRTAAGTLYGREYGR